MLNAAAGVKAMWRHAERLLERSTEVIRTQTGELGESGKRDLICEVLFDIARDGSLLPTGKSASHWSRDTRRTLTEMHEFMRQDNAESFAIAPIIGLGALDQRLQLDRCVPQAVVFEEQPRSEGHVGHPKIKDR